MARDPDQRYPSARHLSMELRHWIDSAEARALRDEARGTATRKTPALRLARIAVPIAALGVLAGLWWAKSERAEETRVAQAALAASAAAPASVAQAAPAPSVVASAAAPAEVASAPLAAVDDAASAAAADTAAASTAATVTLRGVDRPVVSKAEAARRRKALAVATVTDGAPTSAVLAEGVVQLAVSPWGQVEVDGKPMGISPPLSRLTLSAGNHTITVRNADFPPYTVTLAVDGESPVTLRHRFGP